MTTRERERERITPLRQRFLYTSKSFFSFEPPLAPLAQSQKVTESRQTSTLEIIAFWTIRDGERHFTHPSVFITQRGTDGPTLAKLPKFKIMNTMIIVYGDLMYNCRYKSWVFILSALKVIHRDRLAESFTNQSSQTMPPPGKSRKETNTGKNTVDE